MRSAEQAREETERSLRVPGITFADEPAGRRARIAGTGLDVWEIIQRYDDVGGEVEALARQFHWLTGDQLLAALDYYRLYPVEVDERLAAEDGLTLAEYHNERSTHERADALSS